MRAPRAGDDTYRRSGSARAQRLHVQGKVTRLEATLEYDGCMFEKGYIGVFDSGVGGISVLKRLVKEMPHERFVYFGDSANAPYGDKSPEWVRERSRKLVSAMVETGAKAIVVACNTATSAAAATLREEFSQLPIIGIEPALKPATEAAHHDHILVMATSITVKLDKFHKLARRYGSHSSIATVACTGLADLIETGDFESPALHELLEQQLGAYRNKVDGVVLGCTHYPFVAQQIRAVLGDVPLYDGGAGTARQARHLLEEAAALAPASQKGSVIFRSSKNDPAQIELYERFYRLPLKD